MTKSTFSSMFNRLPIHQRPREPAIGEPVLTQSSNERLSGRVGGARPRTSPHERPPDFGKGLPQIPSSTLQEELPPPPRIDSRDRSYSQSSTHRNQLASSNAIAWSRKHHVVRKPAPSSVGMDAWNRTEITSSSEGFTEEHDISNSSSFNSSGATTKGSGFALGNLVKERMGRRQKPVPNHLPEALNLSDIEIEGMPPTIRPMGLNSIDDWLDSREGLHKRSNTASSNTTQLGGHHRESPELTIRHSTFAPLHSHFISESSQPSMPTIPPRFKAKSNPPPRQSSLPQNDTPSRHHPVNRLPCPPITPEKHREPQGPLDHLSQLEYEQKQLESQKSRLRKEIFDVEVLLESSNRPARDQLKEQLEDLNQQYADVEKSAHDLGLKLYRAYRRRDKRDGIEGPTHLWVSRVTAPLEDD